MSHHHCGDESHDHDHDHPPDISDIGPKDNLYSKIDLDNSVVLNATDDASIRDVIKPWHERLDETKALKSDADDQLIIRIRFTGSVKLRALLLKTGPGDQTPRKVALFANEESLDFDDASDKEPTQDFAIPIGREVGEYALKATKFTNVSAITLFFPASQGADDVQLYYLGFLGQYSERKVNPVITVYETQANLADHDKIQGTDGVSSMQQF